MSDKEFKDWCRKKNLPAVFDKFSITVQMPDGKILKQGYAGLGKFAAKIANYLQQIRRENG